MSRSQSKKLAVLAALAAVFAFGLPTAAFANNTFKNPVVQDSGDPFVLQDNGWYYLYLPGGTEVTAYKSQNLLDWTLLGTVYSNAGQSYEGGKRITGLWAPEVHKINGKYYLIGVYVTADSDPHELNNKDIVVIEGTSPTTFNASTRKVLLGADATNFDLYLDPTFFVDTDGRLYLYFKYRKDGTVAGSELRVRPMSDPYTFAPGSVAKTLLTAGNHEHPFMDKKNGNYILFYSTGIGETTSYKIEYATSTSPTGPFTEASENPIMFTWQTAGVIGAGATSIVKDGENTRWMVYRQKVDTGENWNRIVCVNRVEITLSGNVNIVPTRNTYARKPVPLTGPLPVDEAQIRIESSSSRVNYTGTWTLDTDGSDSGGSSRFSGNAGDRASFAFYGDSIRVGLRTGINSGRVNIRLDGTIVASNVDTYSDPTQYQQLIYANDSIALGNHTLSIEPTGTKNVNAGAASVRLDYFEYHTP
ncbi:MAG TPA: family 43 glycosylhydrolase [Myxococcus sp.]|nr:family 43 glycosylhydrolase [Myxococcus sp.]